MDIPEEPAALVFLLVVLTFIFLIALVRGALSDKQQTAAWIIFGILFFSICHLLFRSAHPGTLADPQSVSRAVVGESGVPK